MSDTILELADVIDSLHATPEYLPAGVPMVRVVDINNNFLHLDNCFLVDQETCDRHNKNHTPQKGDVIITRVGSYGMLAYVDIDSRFCLGQNIAIISPYKAEDGKFLYYYMKSPYIQNIIYGNLGGSSYKCIGLEQIKKLPLMIEGIECRKIGDLLYQIDCKIENNRKINAELESMARTIYDYWFLQFDFPDENGRPYKSSGGRMVWNEELKREIPEGWESGNIADLGEIVAGGTPSTMHPEYYSEKEIAWITPNDLSNTSDKYISRGERDISQLGLHNSSAKLLPKGTVLLTSRAPIGYIAIAKNEVCTNQGFKSIVPYDKYGSEYVYHTILNMIPYIKSLGTGSTFTEVSKDVISKVNVVIPQEKIINNFNNMIKTIAEKRAQAETENKELVSLRDFLLPLLMNGQVGFKEC